MAAPIMPLLMYLISGGVGIVIGGLIRQPEINRLKRQVKKLQEDNKRLMTVIEEQHRQILELKKRYHTIAYYNVVEKMRAREQTRMALVMDYAFPLWLDILSHMDQKVEVTKEEKKFFKVFNKVLAGKAASKSETRVFRDFVMKRHGYEIRNMIPTETEYVMDKIGEITINE